MPVRRKFSIGQESTEINMRKPLLPSHIFQERRNRLSSHIAGGALILSANPHYLRNHDVEFEYRQDTNLFYLTGFEEPESVFVFVPGNKPETVLFVRPRDALRETWDGFRYGPERVPSTFGVDASYPISELKTKLPELIKNVDRIYSRLKQYPEFDETLTDILETVRLSRGRSGAGLQTIIDPTAVLGEMRIRKEIQEIEWLQKAADIGSQAHINVMKFCKPGVNERQLQGVYTYSFLMSGSPRVGYNPIVASGANATTLHYNFNDQTCRDGDFLLIDAGNEWNYHTCDITRTYPINGKFTPAQKDFYESVLNVQKTLISRVRVGVKHKELQEETISLLVDAMLNLKLLKGSKEDIIRDQSFKKYYPHGVSHWLGMDVHDAGLYSIEGESRSIEENFCMTIEPGLYVPADDDSAPRELRGLGVRIEDNIVAKKDGPLNLTKSCPKEVSEMEALIGTGFPS